MKKPYVIQTTTYDKWELSGGVQVVFAESKKEAREIFHKRNPLKDEFIKSVELLKQNKNGLVFLKAAVIR